MPIPLLCPVGWGGKVRIPGCSPGRAVQDRHLVKGNRHRKHAAAVLTSRAAEHFFWMARYLERTESLLRLIRGYVKRLNNYRDYGFESDLEVLSGLKPQFDLYCSMGKTAWSAWIPVQTFCQCTKVGSMSSICTQRFAVPTRLGSLVWGLLAGRRRVGRVAGGSERNLNVVALDQFIQPFLNALLAFWGACMESVAVDQGDSGCSWDGGWTDPQYAFKSLLVVSGMHGKQSKTDFGKRCWRPMTA